MSHTILVADKATAGSIKSWQNYSKIDSEGVLEEAQTMIYTRLRAREMKASDTFPVRVGAGSVDVPDGFLEGILLKDVTNGYDIDFKDDVELEGLRTWTAGVLDSGDPAFYSVFDEELQFDCRTTTAWTLRALFYKQPDLLSSSNKTNFLTRRYPHVLRMACLATGARFAHDDEIFAREQRLLFAEIDEIKAVDEMGRNTDIPVEE